MDVVSEVADVKIHSPQGNMYFLYVRKTVLFLYLKYPLTKISWHVKVICSTRKFFQMSSFCQMNILLFCFNMKKNTVEARRLLEEAYGEYAPSPVVEIGLNISKVEILTFWIKIFPEDPIQLTTPNTKICVGIKRVTKTSMPWEKFWREEHGKSLNHFRNLPGKKNIWWRSTSTARLNRFEKETMLWIFWEQKGIVCYELLKQDQIVL